MTPEFHSLCVREVRPETADALCVTFDVPEALRRHYAFTPGQHVTLRLTLEGEELRRNYSICAAPHEGRLRIGIKRHPHGRVSGWLNDHLKAGARIDVMTPTGRFTTVPDAGAALGYLAIAAGSGITPVLSLAASLLEVERRSRVVLLFANRTSRSIMFRSALEDLKDRHLDRFVVLHALTRERQDASRLDGRIDADKIKAVLRGAFPAALPDLAFLCGPTPLIKLARASLEAAGLARERIKYEVFAAQAGARRSATRSAAEPEAAAAAGGTEARVTLNGREAALTIRPEETVLEAAIRAGLEAPFACRGGMCCTCRARLTEGEVAMDHNYSLEPWELAAGFVLTCQSRPKSARIAVDYDAR